MSLCAENISVEFGGVRALSGVSCRLDRGEIASLVGPNGAGKTTLFNCLTGFVTPSAGRIEVDEKDVSGLPPHLRARLGIGRTFQTPRLDPDSTVRAAVSLGALSRIRPSLLGSLLGTPAVRAQEREVDERTEGALRRVGLAAQAGRIVRELSLAQMRLLEVARAIVAAPRFLLLDEPAAGVGVDQRRVLAATLRALAADGIGVLLVEHNLDFVASVSDRITVLHQGRDIFQGTPAQFRTSPEVRAAYIGGSEATPAELAA